MSNIKSQEMTVIQLSDKELSGILYSAIMWRILQVFLSVFFFIIETLGIHRFYTTKEWVWFAMTVLLSFSFFWFIKLDFLRAKEIFKLYGKYRRVRDGN